MTRRWTLVVVLWSDTYEAKAILDAMPDRVEVLMPDRESKESARLDIRSLSREDDVE